MNSSFLKARKQAYLSTSVYPEGRVARGPSPYPWGSVGAFLRQRYRKSSWISQTCPQYRRLGTIPASLGLREGIFCVKGTHDVFRSLKLRVKIPCVPPPPPLLYSHSTLCPMKPWATWVQSWHHNRSSMNSSRVQSPLFVIRRLEARCRTAESFFFFLQVRMKPVIVGSKSRPVLTHVYHTRQSGPRKLVTSKPLNTNLERTSLCIVILGALGAAAYSSC